MGCLKQHVQILNKTFLEHVIERLSAICREVGKRYFVGQPSDLKSQTLVQEAGGIWISNERPELGPLYSIRLACTQNHHPEPFLLWPIDHPFVQISTLITLISHFNKDPESITIPSDGLRRGHPSIFPTWAWPKIFEAPLEEGAKWIVRNHPSRIKHIFVSDPWIRKNLNTPEALTEAQNILSKALGNVRALPWTRVPFPSARSRLKIKHFLITREDAISVLQCGVWPQLCSCRHSVSAESAYLYIPILRWDPCIQGAPHGPLAYRNQLLP